MSALFLYSKDAHVNVDAVLTVFADKGYEEPHRADLGQFHILVYPFQMTQDSVLEKDGEGNAIFVSGVLAYRGKDRSGSLRALLEDARIGRINHDELIGFYCAVFQIGDRIKILTDPSGLSPLFADSDGSFISTSLMAALVAGPQPRKVNREALLEQLLTGSVLGPDTIFHGLHLVTQARHPGWSLRGVEILDGPEIEMKVASQNEGGFDAAVDRQLRILDEYFEKLRNLAVDKVTGLGLSGGYDSRLVLLLAQRHGLSISAHSYGSASHGVENSIAEQLALAAGIPFERIPVELYERMPVDRGEMNVRDGLHFYDGRTNLTMGSFNDVHTRHTRIRALKGCEFAMNGLGGELYRNREHYPSGGFSFDDWFAYFVMTPRNAMALTPEGRDIIEAVKDKHRKCARLDPGKKFTRTHARLHYRNAWLTFSAGPKHAAESTLTPHIIPFADARVSAQAMSINPWIGVSGDFEAAMITRLSRSIARIPSTYGHTFDALPAALRFRHQLYSLIRPGPRMRIAEFNIRRGRRDNRDPGCPQEGTAMRDAWDVLMSLHLPVDYEMLTSDRADRDRTWYLARFLSMYRSHLDLSGS